MSELEKALAVRLGGSRGGRRCGSTIMKDYREYAGDGKITREGLKSAIRYIATQHENGVISEIQEEDLVRMLIAGYIGCEFRAAIGESTAKLSRRVRELVV